MSKARYDGKPTNRRRARANVWTFRQGSHEAHGVQLRIEDKRAWLSPGKAYELANTLVDAAERAETRQAADALAADAD